MISIKRLLEQHRGAKPDDRLEASLQMGRLLLDGLATHLVRGRDADVGDFRRTLKGLLRKLDEPPSADHPLEVASLAVDALENYAKRTTGYLREQNEQMQAMVAMLTETLADVSKQSDVSVARLQVIERQIEQASGLDDMRALSASLESCLSVIRDAVAQQRKGSAATVQRLQDHIQSARKRVAPNHTSPRFDPADFDIESAVAESSYVAVFKLQRADHIAARFGESVKPQMLALISQTLKSVLGPGDRLLRWQGTSLVMFLKSASTIQEVRMKASKAVAKTGQKYIEVGRNSALLSVGVDWIVFPLAQCPTPDAVLAEVDAFLAGETVGDTGHDGEKPADPVRRCALAEDPGL